MLKNAADYLQKPLGQLQSGLGRCKSGFRCGFSQLTIAPEGGEYQTVRFPNSAENQFFLPVRLGTKETCEEML
jgi:hypothetical protein